MRDRFHIIALAVVLALTVSRGAAAASIDCGAGGVQCLIAALNQAGADPQHKTTIHPAGGTYALTEVDNNTDGPNGLPFDYEYRDDRWRQERGNSRTSVRGTWFSDSPRRRDWPSQAPGSHH